MAKSILDILIKVSKSGTGDRETTKSLAKLKGAVLDSMAVFGAAAGAYYALDKVLGDSVRAAMEGQRVHAQLAAALESTAWAAGLTHDELNDMASAMQRVTTFSDEAVGASQALLLTFTNIGEDVFPIATQAILDMSIAMGQDLKSATIMVGKATNDPIRGLSALAEVGVSFTEDQRDLIHSLVESGQAMEAQKIILQELNREFGGSAAAALDTYAGKMQHLGNTFEDVKEGVGTRLLPSLTVDIEHLDALIAGEKSWIDIQKENMSIRWDMITQGGELRRMWDGERFVIRRVIDDGLDPATRGYIAMAQAIRSQSVPAIQEEIDATVELEDQKRILAASLDGPVADAYERYNDTMADLEGEHATLQADLDKLRRWGWPDTSQKIQDATAALGENEQAQKDAAAAMDEAIKRMIYQQVAASLDSGAQLELARNLGLISEKDYAIASALDTLKEKYDINHDGVVDATEDTEGYITAVGDLQAAIEGLPDEAVINVVTNFSTNGSVPDIRTVGTPRYAEGGSFVVPPGFPNDSYPLRVQSGELVTVVPADQVRGMKAGVSAATGAMALNNYGTIDIHLSGDEATLDEFMRQLGLAV